MKSTKSKNSKIKQSAPKVGMTVNFSGVPQTDDATNGDYKTEFAVIESLVLSQFVGRSIGLNDFVTLSKSMNIPFAAIQKNFDAFVKKQTANKKLVEIPSCYETQMWVVL
jgi:hypothetical protein